MGPKRTLHEKRVVRRRVAALCVKAGARTVRKSHGKPSGGLVRFARKGRCDSSSGGANVAPRAKLHGWSQVVEAFPLLKTLIAAASRSRAKLHGWSQVVEAFPLLKTLIEVAPPSRAGSLATWARMLACLSARPQTEQENQCRETGIAVAASLRAASPAAVAVPIVLSWCRKARRLRR